MKKLLFIGIGFALAVAVFAGAGFAYAQTQQPPVPADDNPLHDYMPAALSEVFGLSEEQAAALQTARDTMIALRADRTPEEMQAAMQQAFNLAVENALADGAITQEQADQMLASAQRRSARQPGNTPQNPRAQVADAFRKTFEAGKRAGRQQALLQPYVEAAIADYLGVSVEELQQMRADGLTWISYAQEQGLSDEEIAALRVELFTTAINNALADGTITQEQADQMIDRLQNPVRQPRFGGQQP